jgi:DNA-binding transcriptional LysR family regulator
VFEAMKDSDHWLGLQMRHLVALKAIADEGTFARAAARLGYTPSAISQQIASLEAVVAPDCARATAWQAADRPHGGGCGGPAPRGRDARPAAGGPGRPGRGRGRVRRGRCASALTRSVGAQILPSVLPRFVSEWPEIEVQLHESASDYELLDLVERGELDLTFCMLPLEEGPFEALELLADPTSSSCRPTRRWSAGGASRSAR